MKKQLQQMAVALALGISSLAHGAEVNFDAPDVIVIDGGNAVYSEAGFAISGTAGSFLTIDNIGTGMSGALALLANNHIKLTATGGVPFNFSGLDAGLLGSATAGTLSITGFFFDSTQQMITLSLTGLSNYSLPTWSSLSSLTFSGNADLVLDKLVLTPVPEPGTVGMLLFGLATLVGARRFVKKQR